MRRCLFTIFSAASLLLWVATVVLWARSYAVTDVLEREWLRVDPQRRSLHRQYWWAAAEDGRVHLQHVGEVFDAAAADNVEAMLRTMDRTRRLTWRTIKRPPNLDPESLGHAPGWLRTAGFDYDYEAHASAGTSNVRGRLPFWAVAAAAGLTPVAWVVGRGRRYRRLRRGLCPSCGYDIRATPGLCPECGRCPPNRRT